MRDTVPTVIFIPPKPEAVRASKRQLRVAAYCRVSTDDKEQLTSYEAQKNYYTDKGADGRPEIIPEQADVVRKIYDLFLSGTPIRGILEHLNLVFSCPTLTGEDGHTGEHSAGVCLTEIKPPYFCSRLMRAFGAG